MPTYLPLLLSLGIPALIGAAAFVYFKRKLDGPNASIVVVDWRTMDLALKRIEEATAAGRHSRALFGLVAADKWLTYEEGTGPARQAARRAAARARLDEAAAILAALTGAPA